MPGAVHVNRSTINDELLTPLSRHDGRGVVIAVLTPDTGTVAPFQTAGLWRLKATSPVASDLNPGDAVHTWPGSLFYANPSVIYHAILLWHNPTPRRTCSGLTGPVDKSGDEPIRSEWNRDRASGPKDLLSKWRLGTPSSSWVQGCGKEVKRRKPKLRPSLINRWFTPNHSEKKEKKHE